MSRFPQQTLTVLSSAVGRQLRFYARGAVRRKPLRLLTQDEANSPRPVDSQLRVLRNERPVASETGWKARLSGAQETDRFRLPPNVKYERLEEGDKRFGSVILACKNRKMRGRSGQILLEGHRLIKDAIEGGAKVKSLYFSTVEALADVPNLANLGAQLFKVKHSEVKVWSDVVSPMGLMAVCELPSPGSVRVIENPLPLTLICDKVRDPGNMGTLLRSALAVGCRRVIATKGCVDIWDPKVLRSGAGAHFSLSILPSVGWELLGNYLPPSSHVYLADCAAEDMTPAQVSPRVMKQITQTEHVKHVEVNEETKEYQEVDSSFLDKKTVPLYKSLPLARGSCFDADFTGGETVIVIGGETEGLSAEAHKLAFDHNGEKIYIPMTSHIDSLNASMAATVIMFEVKRQLLQCADTRHITEEHGS